jgi:hypothetical protein
LTPLFSYVLFVVLLMPGKNGAAQSCNEARTLGSSAEVLTPSV